VKCKGWTLSSFTTYSCDFSCQLLTVSYHSPLLVEWRLGRASTTRVAMANPCTHSCPLASAATIHLSEDDHSTIRNRVLHFQDGRVVANFPALAHREACMRAKRCRPSRQAASSRLRQLGSWGCEMRDFSLQPASPSDRAIYSCFALPSNRSIREWRMGSRSCSGLLLG
jgi:hypothetical protein